jgi:protein-S-isoprenylcysteine O-methyltransferase Ste14
VAGLIPWWITRWRVEHALPLPLRAAGAALLAAGAALLLPAFWRFAVEGLGTPAPVTPTERLVVGGLYARVRNPMYLGVTGAITGQALLLGSTALALYGAAALACMVAFVRLYEEPALSRRYGADYDAYRRTVPGWWPRLARPSSSARSRNRVNSK